MNRKWLRALLCTTLALAVVIQAPNLGEGPTLAKPTVERDRYGIEMHAYQRQLYTVEPRETLASILRDHNVAAKTIARVGSDTEPVFDVRKIRAGSSLYVYADSATGSTPIFVYPAEPTRYVVFDFRDSVAVYAGFIKPTVTRKETRAIISQSLYEALDAVDASTDLAMQMARIFAWQVDFYRLNKGDQFSVVYEESSIDGSVTAVEVLAARFQHGGQDYDAYGFRQDDGTMGYYDAEGNALKRQFLRAPLEYTRISSRYSRRRFHPVQKRFKPHLGTDFAAPYGTPIVATAEGVVVAAGYGSANGRYVKIRHSEIYTTGYLHMSRIAVKRNQRVRQGDVIGYVGNTGSATGPHVCYRFWQRGRQVDPLELALPPATPIDAKGRALFDALRETYESSLTL